MKDSIKIADIRHGRELKADYRMFGVKSAERVREFHKSFAEYNVTPLVSLDCFAEDIGLSGSELGGFRPKLIMRSQVTTVRQDT